MRFSFRHPLSIFIFCVLVTCSVSGRAFQTPQNTVKLTITAMDEKHRLIGGLQQRDFEVAVDGKPLEVISFASDDQPASVGFLVDVSGSIMSEGSRLWIKRQQLLAQGIAAFLKASNPANEYFVTTFSTETNVALDWVSGQEVLRRSIDISPKGHTAFYDACYEGLKKVSQGRHSKHVLIAITDGQDNASQLPFKKLRDALKDSDVLLYSVGIVADAWAGSSLGQEGQGILDELSTLTGGVAFFPRIERDKDNIMLGIFGLMAQEIRNQYHLTVGVSEPAAARKWRSIKVKVNPQTDVTNGSKFKIDIRARKGFYN